MSRERGNNILAFPSVAGGHLSWTLESKFSAYLPCVGDAPGFYGFKQAIGAPYPSNLSGNIGDLTGCVVNAVPSQQCTLSNVLTDWGCDPIFEAATATVAVDPFGHLIPEG
eukprot:6040976-Pyramimonas_sp.AAC.1